MTPQTTESLALIYSAVWKAQAAFWNIMHTRPIKLKDFKSKHAFFASPDDKNSATIT